MKENLAYLVSGSLVVRKGTRVDHVVDRFALWSFFLLILVMFCFVFIYVHNLKH